MKNKVYCMDNTQFAWLCYEFTRLGLTFEAEAEKFTITLTGGF